MVDFEYFLFNTIVSYILCLIWISKSETPPGNMFDGERLTLDWFFKISLFLGRSNYSLLYDKISFEFCLKIDGCLRWDLLSKSF